MTLLTCRPELALALSDEPPMNGSADEGRDEFSRIAQRMRALVASLSRVHSLSAAQAARVAPEYVGLAMQWAEARRQHPELAPETDAGSPLFDLFDQSDMIPGATRERLYGALKSSTAYFDWLTRNYDSIAGGEMPHTADVVDRAGYAIAGAEAAFLAIGLILKGVSGSAFDALPILAELVDRIWTEVEDAFMSLAEYDNESGAVPLSEVKAELGL